ncbi:MAG TPA: response regulator, partial [Telmatospirillum sp.]|nr:response regulator [Telmatospirillum sp.]
PVSPSTFLDTILSVLGRGQILDKPDRQGTRAAGSVTAGCLTGARLLLVEDNDINREFAGKLLRSEGIDVDEAVTGREAVDKVRQQSYDAVLMDIQMPVMDGLQAARLIRGLAEAPGGERFATLPIIAMTALAMAHDAEKSQAAGMNDHVTKPIVPERLLSALVKWIHLPQDRMATARPFAVTASAAVEFPADLAALGSLDAREGVRRIGGRLESYRKQLRRFREHYPDAVAELRRMVRENRLGNAEDYCHALKGVCGNIGAVALYEKTVEIDSRLRQGEVPDDASLEEMRVLLAYVMADIDSLAVLPATAAAEPRVVLSRTEIGDRLERLRRALEYDLGEAEGLLAELRGGLAGDVNEPVLTEISAKADIFAIDEALALVDVLRERLQFAT